MGVKLDAPGGGQIFTPPGGGGRNPADDVDLVGRGLDEHEEAEDPFSPSSKFWLSRFGMLMRMVWPSCGRTKKGAVCSFAENSII